MPPRRPDARGRIPQQALHFGTLKGSEASCPHSGALTQWRKDQLLQSLLNFLMIGGMAGAAGLEPVTSAVTGQRSNQLSYAPAKTAQNVGNGPGGVNR